MHYNIIKGLQFLELVTIKIRGLVEFLAIICLNRLTILSGTVDGKLITLPLNVTTTGSSPVLTLTCSTSWPIDPVNWDWKSNDIDSEFKSIYVGGQVVKSSNLKYNVTRSIAYTLNVLNVTSADTGTFRCVDKGGQGPDEGTANIVIAGELSYRLIIYKYIYIYIL